MMLAWYVTVCVTSLVVTATRGESVEVMTRQGSLRGTRTLIQGTYVRKFLKLPFARPPTGDLRFRPPQAPGSWSGVRDGTKMGPQCPQQPIINYPVGHPMHFENDEDCLYLNIYAPEVTRDSKPLPVMVWFPGGGYFFGTANFYDSSLLAVRGVVVVAANYRLDALGFLSTEDGASPGNYGLLDQIRALEWVKESISAFNGDPNDVTIFGESASASSISLLIQSRAARGLFQKAVLESGSSLCPWAVGYPQLDPKPRDQAQDLARRVGCSVTDSSQMVACLRTIDAKTIIDTTAEMLNASIHLLFRPVPETTFGQYGMFAATPETILQNGWFANVTTLRGFNANEQGGTVKDPEDDGLTVEEFKNYLDNLVKINMVQSTVAVDTEKIKLLLIDAYVHQRNITDPKELRSAYIELATDFQFVAPILHELQMTVRHPVGTQYLYRFSFRSPNRLSNPWQGVKHSDELSYVFGTPIDALGKFIPGFVSQWAPEDRVVSEHVMSWWTNVAKYGNPTPDGTQGVKWLPWTRDSPHFMDITSNPQLLTSPITPRISLWINTIFKMLHRSNGNVVG